jgi:DivIVA domain-containing protein
VSLERRAIESPDLPVGRRGYDRAAVDAHLRRVADEVERLRAGAKGASSAVASDQVRTILEAAERSADELRARTEAEAQRVRSEASGGAREQFARLAEAAEGLLEEVAVLQSHASRLRTGVATVHDRLRALEDEVPDAAATPWEGPNSEEPARELDEKPEPAPSDAAPSPVAAEEAGEAAPDEEPAEQGPAGGDAEGARLVALNMALSGSSREETERYLAERNFAVADRAALLDDVYAKIGE